MGIVVGSHSIQGRSDVEEEDSFWLYSRDLDVPRVPTNSDKQSNLLPLEGFCCTKRPTRMNESSFQNIIPLDSFRRSQHKAHTHLYLCKISICYCAEIECNDIFALRNGPFCYFHITERAFLAWSIIRMRFIIFSKASI